MIASLSSSFLYIWLIWVIIYLACRYCSMSPREVTEMVRNIRDRVVRHGISANDKVPTFGNAPFCMSRFRALDFLYYTIVLSLITFDLFYIWSG